MFGCSGPIACSCRYKTRVALNQRMASFVSDFQFWSDRSVAWRGHPMIVRLDAVSGSGNNSEQVLFVTFLSTGLEINLEKKLQACKNIAVKLPTKKV